MALRVNPSFIKIFGLLVVVLAGSSRAQMPEPEGFRPAAAGRMVASFDFEEQSTNPGEVPLNWYRAQDTPGGVRREGFPEWNRAVISYDAGIAYEGAGAVRLPTKGGATSLILNSGVVPIFQDADYVVQTKVRCVNIAHARPFLVVRVIDRTGKIVDSAEYGAHVENLPANNGWSTLKVTVPGGHKDAAFLQIELQVLQPKQYKSAELGEHDIWQEDIAGAAYFDNLTVVQPPRVELKTSHPSNITVAPQSPVISLSIRDMTGEALSAMLSVRDITGNLVDTYTLPMQSGQASEAWTPTIATFGWYRCTLDIYSTSTPPVRVGGSTLDFCYIPKPPAQGTRDRFGTVRRFSLRDRDAAMFGVDITDTNDQQLQVIPAIAQQLNIRYITLPILTEDLTLKRLTNHNSVLSRIIDSLLGDDRSVAFSLNLVPAAFAQAANLGPADVWTFLRQDTSVWLPILTPLMDRYGQRISSWRVGRTSDALGPDVRIDLGSQSRALTSEFAKLVSGPRIVTPVQIAAIGIKPSEVSISAILPADSTPQEIEQFLNGLTDAPRAIDSLTLSPMSAEIYDAGFAAADTVKKLVSYWSTIHRDSAVRGIASPTPRLDITQPWRIEDDRNATVHPSVVLPAWTHTITKLSGRRMAGKFPVAPGVVCWILSPVAGEDTNGVSDGNTGGALVMWNETALPQDAVLEASLGQGNITVSDMFGNISPAPRVSDGQGRTAVHIKAGPFPVFIEGIDIDFTRFLAGVRVEPALLESNNARHELHFTVDNPWPTPITGKMNILRPGGFDDDTRDRSWRVSPRSMQFTVPANSTARFPFTVSFSPAEEVGPKDFVMEVTVAAQRQYQPVLVTRTMEVGLADLNMELSLIVARAEEGQAPDVIIEAALSNTGRRNRTLTLTSFAPDLPRLKTSISDLSAGTQSLRRFTYPGGLAQLRGKKLLITASDAHSEAQITRSITVP